MSADRPCLWNAGWLRPAVVACLTAGTVWVACDLAASRVRAADTEAARPTEGQPARPSDEASLEFFEKQVRPLLANRCGKCHGPEAQELKGGLRIDSRAALLAGGDTGPALVPGKPGESMLIDAINYGDLYQMPPKTKLPAEEIAILTRWVEIGAPWPATDSPPSTTANPQANAVKPFNLADRKQSHWAWQSVRPQDPPRVTDAAWPQSPLDRFILAKLEAQGLRPAPAADRDILLRRVTFDLIGLPPTLDELDAFEHDTSSDALAHVVDRLLASPHFGERWARHWLDLMRYAESRGHEYDPNIPNAWHYRDYVVRALNADLPYDRLIQEHIAGDLLAEARRHPTAGFNESILATGFWFLGEESHSPVDLHQDEADRIDNRLDVACKSFLALTVSCARCHDHKFDAISQQDYYALSGYLSSSQYRQVRFETEEQDHHIAEQLDALRVEARRELLPLVVSAEQPGLGRLADYLRAARRLPTGDAPQNAAGATDIETAIVAESAQLDTELVGRWVAELGRAAGDPRHPLHAYAVIAVDPEVDKPERFTQLREGLVQRWNKETEAVEAGLAGRKIVVDYRSATSQTWLSDGVAFGLQPRRPGELQIFGSADQPELGLVTYGAATREPAFKVLKSAVGSEMDHARIGEWDRGGRSLRSPEFTLTEPNLWYLVRGSGRAYASIQSHLMIAGPLHGAALIEWQGQPDQWQWVEHGLAGYLSHRLHVEFVPREGDDLAVALVVQSADRPALPQNRPNGLLAAALAQADIRSLDDLARSYQRLFGQVAARLADAQFGESADAALLADWLVRSADLFVRSNEESRTRLQAALAAWALRQAQLEKQVTAASHTAPAILDANGNDAFLLVRGNAKTPGKVAPRRFLEALGGREHMPTGPGSGRLELALQITDPANPLTARVEVNRLWYHIFGRGIVASVDNFGVLGERPTHPELLDFLAAELIREGWSVKRLIRTMVLSRTYQMASSASPEMDEADPDNRWLHRMRIRRLEGEAIRDALLLISGRLDRTMFGPGVPIHLTSFMEGRGRPEHSGPLDGAGRRSVYLAVRRNFLSPMMLAFDTPNPFSTVGRRTVSNVPAQALILMNDPMVIEQAQLWAQRLLAEPALTAEQRIATMYRSALSRDPATEETGAALEFLEQQGQRYGIAADQRLGAVQPWADLCHVIFNVKEFTFIR